MNKSIEQLKEKIELFRNNIKDYKGKNYDEYNTRADFIDTMFASFGWDMYNEQGVIEQFREVIREDKVVIQGKKKGTGSVDKGFLVLLNKWREILATNIALRNVNIDEYNLNIAVQKIIDRLLFLRIAEDRLIEEPNFLINITKSQGIYQMLLDAFIQADNKYNSGLFVSEDWLQSLIVEDNTYKEIIDEMYYPKCPYVTRVS